MQGENFLIIGNDKKMQSCSMRLNDLGYESLCSDTENIKRILPAYSNIILPLPTVANGCVAGTGLPLNEFNEMLDCDQHVFYGNIANAVFTCKAYSYYYNEGFLIKNSRLTAQGVLKLIINSLEEDMYGISAAVVGYGRCGKAICRSLKSNSADVTAFFRREEIRAQIENDGLKAKRCQHIDDELYKYNIIINTVPKNIIGEKVLERLTNKNLYIEIASKPYGFDIGKADKFNFRYILAESLPGKYFPVSAGRNIADTVLGIIKEGKDE
jgi:hypothetical protein